MATLADLKDVLESIDNNILSQGTMLSTLVQNQDRMLSEQERQNQIGRADKTIANQSLVQRMGYGPGSTTSSNSSGAGAGLAGIGLGLAGFGIGAAKGLGALGIAMPAFFGGLLAGDAGLGWISQFGSGFDFNNLKSAIVGFTDIISDIDDESLIKLGAIMGISMLGGVRGAAGLGTMGLGISAFLGGLLAGDAVFSGVTALGGNLNFSGMKSALVGFSDMIGSIDPKSLTTLGIIMGGSAVTGLLGKNPYAVATGLGAMGLGISAFLGGLLAGDALFSGVSALGGNLDFGSLRTVLGGFSSAIDALSPEAAAALAGIAGVSLAASAFGSNIKDALQVAVMMTGIGAGISGLMIGLTAGEVGTEWIRNASGIEGGGLAAAFEIFSNSIDKLSPAAMTALAGIIGISGLLGAFGTGPAAALGIATVMTGIGAGISGLMVGLAAGDFITSYLQQYSGNGPGIVGIFETFNDSILAITPAAIERLKKLVELGGFDIVGAMTGLTAGIAVLLGAEGISSTLGKVGDAFWGSIDSIFGSSLSEEKPGIIQQMVDGLAPLDNFDVDKIDKFTDAINRLSGSFTTLSSISTGEATSNLGNMIRDIGGIMEVLPYMLEGGKFDPRSGVKGTMQWLFGNDSDVIDFGNGINNLDLSGLEKLAIGINTLEDALGNISGVIPESSLDGISTINNAGANGGVLQSTPIIINAPNNSTTQVNQTGGSASSVINSFGGNSRNDLDYMSRPAGVN
jgi:hypothetical protein